MRRLFSRLPVVLLIAAFMQLANASEFDPKAIRASDTFFLSSFEEGEVQPCVATPDQDQDGLLDPACVQVFVPPDPAAVAPPLDPTVITDFTVATQFLTEGANTIQHGTAPGTFQPYRVAVMRGIIHDENSQPLPGVLVRSLNHPEYGYTYSRADGAYDFRINGGGDVTLDFQKTGFIHAQRTELTPWKDWLVLDDVTLIAFDSVATVVNFSAVSGQQVHRASTITDADGSRTATLIVPPGTEATLRRADGSGVPVSTLTLRATEFTVGPGGPARMPATLPETSGYTYAVELSADEAIAQGARSVEFSKPLVNYLENFLHFPVGTPVPVGYYDYAEGHWIPSDNGRVIKVLAIAGALAELDLDGSGTAANQAALDALGIDFAEQTRLAALYAAGQELWRVPVNHFSPWDYNWPYGPPADAVPPQQPDAKSDDKLDDPCLESGSIIECENQTLRERLPVAGTPFTFNYSSDRVPGRKAAYTLSIPMSGDSVPNGLQRIRLEIIVAGTQLTLDFPALPNQTYVFLWDGKDGFGRVLQGSQIVTVRVGYVYQAEYQEPAQFPQSFGMVSGVRISGNPARKEITLWHIQAKKLGIWDARAIGIGAWALDVQHAYDLHAPQLLLGSGERSSSAGFGEIISTVAGDGSSIYSADGIPAVQEGIYPSGIAVAADGSLYIADEINNRIRRVGVEGTITTVAGNGTYGYSGDGGLATQATLRAPTGVTIGADGGLYIADEQNSRVRRVDSRGMITTIAGNGTTIASGDGGPAVQAGLNSPWQIAAAPDGGIYVANYVNGSLNNGSTVRRIGPNGIITTVAGDGTGYFSGDSGPAIQAGLGRVTGMATGMDSSLYIADSYNGRLRRVSTDGIISTVAGNGGSYSGDGGLATQAGIGYPSGIAIAADGNIYGSESWFGADIDSRVRRIGRDGTITTIAGKGVGDYSGDGGPALQAGLYAPTGLAIARDGSLYISDVANNRVRRVGSPFPGLRGNEIGLASTDGRELYQFDATGRHLRTLDALTGAELLAFDYSNGLLSLVTDGDGNQTRIEHDGAGHPTRIIAPDGQITTFTVDPNGYLASIANPLGEVTRMTYSADGLLSSFTDPLGNASVLEYDPQGRLRKDTNAETGYSALLRTETANGYTVSLTTALGRVTTHGVATLSTGDRERTQVSPSGAVSMALKKSNGTTTTAAADGTIYTEVKGPDPRFGMQAPIIRSLTVALPNGATSQIDTTRTVNLSDPADPMSLTSLSNTVMVNSREYLNTFAAASRSWSVRSPMGRETLITVDAQERPLQVTEAGLAPLNYAYDPRGRLSGVSAGSGAEQRDWSFTYDANGYLATITDPLTRLTTLSNDAAGRTLMQTLPDGRNIGFQYDANSNVTAVIPPGRPSHGFVYNAVDQVTAYVPPTISGVSNPATSYSYNLDQIVTGQTRQGSVLLSPQLNPASGLAVGLTTPQGQYAYTRDPVGRISDEQAPGAIGLHRNFNGPLLMGESTDRGATASAAVGYQYDANFWLTHLDVSVLGAIATGIDYGYDDDGLLTSASVQSQATMALARSPQNGLLTGTTLGLVTDSWSYNAFAEPSAYAATFNGTALYASSYTRDKLGRITQKVETVAGLSETSDYAYDLAGRLDTVTVDGALIADYGYDSNSNRLSVMQTGAGIPNSGCAAGLSNVSASVDAQDRLLTYGTCQYQYTDNGELTAKTDSSTSAVTTYQYDSFSNLRHVSLPDGRNIDYTIDGRNRRIGKSINGVIVQGLIYLNDLEPVAETDASGNRIATFIYADRANTPSYLLKGGNVYRVISDHLGSVRLVVNVTDGSIAQRLDYDAWGQVLLDTNPGFQPFGFAGGIYDRDTGLVRFGARDYDPETGRWTNKDPIGFGGGVSNLYGYVGANPINNIDPFGLTELTFDTDGGKLTVDPQTNGTGIYTVPGSSGRPGCADCDETTRDQGSIPKGNYTLLTNQITDPGPIGDILRNLRGDWGDWRVPLQPDKGTDTHTRAGFFLHGGNFAGSAGCIDIGGGTFGNSQTDRVLQDIRADPDGIVRVIIK